jgi:hypothetical protein
MNRELEQTAADIIMTYDEDALVEMFSTMGEVWNSKTLARLIVENRRKSKIDDRRIYPSDSAGNNGKQTKVFGTGISGASD